MGKGELLSIGEMLPALHAMGKGLEVAHHIGSARAFHGQIHRPEAPVVGKMHGEMHGARSCVHGECADAHGRRVGSSRQALRQRLARRPARRNGGTAIAYLLERLGLREVGDRQRHAVLAHAFEARGGGAIAIIVDDARLEIGEHDIDVEVIRNARSRGHPTGNHRRIIASPHPPICDRRGMGGDAHAPRHGAWVSVFRQLDTTQAHSAPFPIKISVSHSTPKAGSGEGATGHFPPLSNFEAFDGESAGPRPRRAAMRVTPVRASAVPRPG